MAKDAQEAQPVQQVGGGMPTPVELLEEIGDRLLLKTMKQQLGGLHMQYQAAQAVINNLRGALDQAKADVAHLHEALEGAAKRIVALETSRPQPQAAPQVEAPKPSPATRVPLRVVPPIQDAKPSPEK